MINGCYYVHLYCDNDKVNHRLECYQYKVGEFTGETRAQCLTEARKKGWTIKKGIVLCPYCKRKQKVG